MNRKQILFSVVMLAASFLIFSSYSSGITGKSVTGCGGSTCHVMDNSTTILVTGIPSTGFKYDSIYSMTLSVINAGKAGAGFNLKCDIGSLIAGNNMLLNGSKELYHSTPQLIVNAAGVATWTFNWKAPSSGNATASFFVAGNSINNNGFSSGDAFVTDAFYFDKDTNSVPNAIESITENKISIYPNPVSTTLQIECSNHAPMLSAIQLIDFQGRQVPVTCSIKSPTIIEVQLGHLPSGIYFLKLHNEVRRIVKI